MRHVHSMPFYAFMPCLLSLLGLLSSGCAATRAIRPVGQGHLVAGASVGGPIFNNLAVPVVAPLTSVYGRYGLSHRTDVDMGLMLPVGRVVGADVGVSHLVLRPRGPRPALMAGGRVALLGNARAWVQARDVNTQSALGFGPEVFEELYVNASWRVSRDALAFVGGDVFAQAHHETFRPSVTAGFVWQGPRGVSLQAQVNWLAVHRESRMLSVRYVSVGDRGALAMQLGIAYDFGRLGSRAVAL